MAEYCNSEIGREPYLPNLEELCIAQCPPYPQWFRGVVCEGAAGGALRVCYVDYGNVGDARLPQLRKMVPDFVRARPALATHVELRGFPENPSEEMLAKALVHMKVNDEGRGELKVTRCEKIEPGLYIVDAPDLLRAMGV
ncbi:tudor domain-containing protein 1-like [Vanessa cardui]|uniref:tudor domain-containing protein 1-like n=1 Tax=Vanessa cardui TaxID=171605 RepID=UPI001F143ED5|nr:tudor domain-containing protein 1-like [Vanessa cardui]